MKTFVIILIAIVWIVVRIVQAAKKQQQAQQKRPTSPTPGTQQQQAPKSEAFTLESLLKGLVDEPPKPKRQEQISFAEADLSKPEQIQNKNSVLYPDAMDQEVLEALMKEGQSSITDTVLEVEDLGDGEGIDLEFDIRKAVLFSEILNNPFLEKNY